MPQHPCQAPEKWRVFTLTSHPRKPHVKTCAQEGDVAAPPTFYGKLSELTHVTWTMDNEPHVSFFFKEPKETTPDQEAPNDYQLVSEATLFGPFGRGPKFKSQGEAGLSLWFPFTQAPFEYIFLSHFGSFGAFPFTPRPLLRLQVKPRPSVLGVGLAVCVGLKREPHHFGESPFRYPM